MYDGINLAFLKFTTGKQFKRYRCTGCLAFSDKHRLFGNRQMHARTLYGIDGGNGTRQFTFYGALMACLFHQLADTKAGITCHQFKTHAGTAR